MKQKNFSYAGETIPFSHYWELCIGSCHAATALREDYRKQLEQVHKDCGFQYVRFHGLFDDDMSVLTQGSGPMKREQAEDGYILSFTNTDSIIDFLLSIGMKPFLELGFLPKALTSGKTTIFHYEGHTSPPDDLEKWGWLVEKFTEHCVERYGLSEVRQWFFEVWNEPNLGGPDREMGFWGGTMEDYFALYEYAARAIKRVDPRLRVGGPATACNEWVVEIQEFCKEKQVPLDFISTHHYPIDVGIQKQRELRAVQQGKPQGMGEEQLSFGDSLWQYVPRGVLTEQAKMVKEQANGLPVYYTEWNSNAQLHSDGPFGAAFVAKTCLDNHGLVEGYSYWTFSDIFEEGGLPHTPFHGGFGLVTLQGVPKAVYRAFQILHKLGGELYTDRLADGTVDLYLVKREAASSLQLLAVNHGGLADPIQAEEISVTMEGLPSFVKATIERIDEEHGNALARWEELGKPAYADRKLICELNAASYTSEEPIEVEKDGENVTLSFTLPEQGIALITLYL